jgi:hypothetical protein
MGVIRDEVALAAVRQDQRRAAYAGGPRQIAKGPGRPRGSDRFPAKRGRRGKTSKR